MSSSNFYMYMTTGGRLHLFTHTYWGSQMKDIQYNEVSSAFMIGKLNFNGIFFHNYANSNSLQMILINNSIMIMYICM